MLEINRIHQGDSAELLKEINEHSIIVCMYGQTINDYLTPSEISEKIEIRLNHVSNFLTNLREFKLVVCLNDNEKRGRLYQITELGKKTVKEIENKNG